MAKRIEIKGLKNLIKELDKFGVEWKKTVSELTEASAREIETNAKMNAQSSVDTGKLRQGIKAIEQTPLEWKVYANATGLAPYSAYVEFGTGGLVEVPQELTEVALKFKGKGIRRIDLRPRPFLYPAYVKGRKQYLEDLEAELKHLVSKI
jgi:HK97 gp10 family phage protein